MNRERYAWSKEEDATIQASWMISNNEELGRMLGRTALAVRKRRSILGFVGKGRYNGRLGKPVRSAIEHVAYVADPMERYIMLQQRLHEVTECRRAAMAPCENPDAYWYRTERRLTAIWAELKKAMEFEKSRMDRIARK